MSSEMWLFPSLLVHSFGNASMAPERKPLTNHDRPQLVALVFSTGLRSKQPCQDLSIDTIQHVSLFNTLLHTGSTVLLDDQPQAYGRRTLMM